MMKKYFYAFLLLFSSVPFLSAQTTGSFQRIVTHNSQPRILEYYVPLNYDSVNTYPLVVGLHGCVGGANPAFGFRNNIRFLADSIGAIVVCPNGIPGAPYSGMMDDPDHTMILTAIDSTLSEYNIDTTEVYLTGFSCNGYVTAKYGTQVLYPWKGIITLHASYITQDFTNGSFEYSTDIKTCICIGSLDPGLSLNQRFRDSLAANGADYHYNLIPGVGHNTSFPSLPQEMMECIHYINGTLASASPPADEAAVKFWPNPASEKINFEIPGRNHCRISMLDLTGRLCLDFYPDNNSGSLDISGLAPGIYYLQVSDETGFRQYGKMRAY